MQNPVFSSCYTAEEADIPSSHTHTHTHTWLLTQQSVSGCVGSMQVWESPSVSDGLGFFWKNSLWGTVGF